MATEAASRDLKVVGQPGRFPRVRLVEPTSAGYILLAAEVDRRLPFLPPTAAKRRLLERAKALCQQLEQSAEVSSAVVFTALLVPPGRGRFLSRRPGQVHIARFDVAVLIEMTSVEAARSLRTQPLCQTLEAELRSTAGYVHLMTASNVRRMGSVDHRRDGVFLFNYFFADDTAQNLAVWEYTAGWFQQETGLDNSTVLLPADPAEAQYTIVNHCRWDGLGKVLPSLILKRSFRDYVLANFEANDTAAMPILYRLA